MQRPGNAQQPSCDEDGLPERVLWAAGTLPVVEDLGHVPGDAELEMLDAPVARRHLAVVVGPLQGPEQGKETSLAGPVR